MVSVDTHGVPGNYPVTLYEQWKQPNGAVNQQFSGSNNYFITTYGSSGANIWIYVAAVAAVAIIAVFALFEKKSAEKEKGMKKKACEWFLPRYIVGKALDKYNVPDWVRPYIFKHAMTHPVSAVKFALSFIDTKRKKGEVTKEYVRLPNGLRIRMAYILRVLNLLYCGEERMAEMYAVWSMRSSEPNQAYSEHFHNTATADKRHARAIKNLIEGLGYKIGDTPKEIMDVFDYVESMKSWNDRIIAAAIVLRGAYASAFGIMFYKVFYPAAPEFMRNFRKAFQDSEALWECEEAIRIIHGDEMQDDHVLELTRNILSRVLYSISANMQMATKSGIEPEVKLLSEIAIAYPFHALKEMGVDVDINKEVENIKRNVAALKRRSGMQKSAKPN